MSIMILYYQYKQTACDLNRTFAANYRRLKGQGIISIFFNILVPETESTFLNTFSVKVLLYSKKPLVERGAMVEWLERLVMCRKLLFESRVGPSGD